MSERIDGSSSTSRIVGADGGSLIILFISIHDALSSTRVNGERPRVVYLHYTDAYGQADRSTMTRARF